MFTCLDYSVLCTSFQNCVLDTQRAVNFPLTNYNCDIILESQTLTDRLTDHHFSQVGSLNWSKQQFIFRRGNVFILIHYSRLLKNNIKVLYAYWLLHNYHSETCKKLNSKKDWWYTSPIKILAPVQFESLKGFCYFSRKLTDIRPAVCLHSRERWQCALVGFLPCGLLL